jgi:hypothetical protein
MNVTTSVDGELSGRKEKFIKQEQEKERIAEAEAR